MTTVALMGRYILWHYTRGTLDALRLSHTFLKFIAHSFSLSTLLTTFFQPWKKEREAYPSIVEPVRFLEAVVVNLLMRIVGMVSRSFLIAVCLLLTLGAISLLVIALILWLTLPILTPALALMGFILMFS